MKKLHCNQIKVLLLVFMLLAQGEGVAQNTNLGIPPIRNFPKKIYKAGTQNWDATQLENGVLFFANNEGLLQFDGYYWRCYPVANKTVVRAVAADTTGRVFVGAQSELGYFFPSENGRLTYHSLTGLLPSDKKNFEDVWDIEIDGKSVFFRTNQSILKYSNGQIEVYEPGGSINAMVRTPVGLIIQRNFSDILRLEQGAFQPLFQLPELKSAITGKMNWKGDTLLVSSLKNGLFYLSNGKMAPWPTAHDAFFKEKRIYCATALPNGQLALGTSLAGICVIDQYKRIFRRLDKSKGIQNNNVLHTFADRSGNLWLGLDNGIDCVVLQSPFTTIIPDAELQGTAYAASVYSGNLFLGVSNGVYQTPWLNYYNPEKSPVFKKMNATDGQVWNLAQIDNVLLLGHHEGCFKLTENTCVPISTEPGAWTFVRLTDQYVLGGAYSGLVLYRKSGNDWVFDQKLDGLNESCRFMVKDMDGAIWVAHPYRGLYRVEWSESKKSEIKVAFFDTRQGLPSNLNNFVFQVASRAVFATENGVYRFDKQKGLFSPDEDFERTLGKGSRVRYLKEDTKGHIWFVADKEVGLLEVDDLGLKKEVRKKVFPELAEKLVAGFEFIYPQSENDVFFGAEHGFIHYNAAKKESLDTTLQLVLSQVMVRNHTRDSMLFGGFFVQNGSLTTQQNPDGLPMLDAGINDLLFCYTTTTFDDPAYVQYRFRLLGLSDSWSEWSAEHARNFTSLAPGSYTFEVQACQTGGKESSIVRFSFRIRPPWYAGTIAYSIYTLLILGIFVGFLLRQRRKFEYEKEHLTVQHMQITAEQQKEVEKSKAAMSHLLNEKLEAEIQFKNKELATATMHLVQKGEILQTVQENLGQILAKSTNPAVKKEIQQLLNLLNYDAKLDEDWEQFAVHFDQVHVDFLKRLREKHPQLSAIDHKLCAYLRMNLTTKEIAPLMNISVRGVEASRYRLRKKLGLPNDANLTEAIADL
ncbi:MAG: hypothetical protein JNJ57_14690 [Saprospiraceae bacterium]|nr:hypothetical protein [Saprospiraceae bacterium]